MSLRIGVGLPTGREGQTYPVPYVRPADFSRIARQAGARGFASLWANDHLTTPREFQATPDQSPRFYDPLVTFASLGRVVVYALFPPDRLANPDRSERIRVSLRSGELRILRSFLPQDDTLLGSIFV